MTEQHRLISRNTTGITFTLSVEELNTDGTTDEVSLAESDSLTAEQLAKYRFLFLRPDGAIVDVQATRVLNTDDDAEPVPDSMEYDVTDTGLLGQAGLWAYWGRWTAQDGSIREPYTRILFTVV